MIDLAQIMATDEAGNEFIKNVTVYQRNNSWVMDFGSFASYYLFGEYGLVNYSEKYKEDQLFYLDAMGQNHKGYGVFITVGQLRKLLDSARKEIKDDDEYLWEISKIQ